MRYENDDRPRCWLHTEWIAVDEVEYDDKLVWVCSTCLEFVNGERLTGYQCKHCDVPVAGETNFTPIHKLHRPDCPRARYWVNTEILA